MGEADDGGQAWLSHAAFEPGDLGEVEAAAMGQLLLGERRGMPPPAEVGPELLVRLHRQSFSGQPQRGQVRPCAVE